MLPQMIGYVKCFDDNKTMPLTVTDNKLLRKNTKVWEIVSNLMNIEFGSEPVYGDNDKCIETKIKMYDNEVNTNFQDEEVPKENVSFDFLSLIILDSVLRVNKKYCS